jgi:voltage-gated potassium channel
MGAANDCDEREACDRDRRELLEQIEDALELPMVALGLAWLGLLVLELTRGLSRGLEIAGTVIWIVFLADFALRFTLAPQKTAYLRENWLTAVALVLPALRVFRVLRILRVARGLRLVRVVSSVNRGMRALRSTMRRRALGYVVALTVLVAFVGAAGMYAFEREDHPGAFGTYAAALWWTAMMMTTMGSEAWPRTPEGRILCVLLALYAFAVFGYLTATLASFFVGRDAEAVEGEIASASSIAALREEIAALRRDVVPRASTRRDG